MQKKGFFVISLDLELYWGMLDKVTLAEYGERIKGVHQVAPKLLKLFEERQIHATWATVGMLMFDSKAELLASLPSVSLQPKYADMRASSYEHIAGSAFSESMHYFAPTLIKQIIATPNQELGSHTFSHYYCIDGEQNTQAVFAADCDAQQKIAAHFGIAMQSIVFPRNQTNEASLLVCKEHGLTAYRGTPEHFLYTGKKESKQTNPLLRILRLVDAYINISGHHTYPLSAVRGSILSNVIGSRFLRPYSRALRMFEKLRIARIKKSMMYAAVHGEVFHLWWHPHNFGIDQNENLANLTELLEHFAMLSEKYGMQSANMREIAIYANE